MPDMCNKDMKKIGTAGWGNDNVRYASRLAIHVCPFQSHRLEKSY